MLMRWLPWKYLLQRAAHHYGFIDPVGVLARLRRFAQPSGVQEPIELLRAGVSFHARGLVNTKAIQTNLDWLWPYWVERQFNPADPSFIPRAFSFSHVNLTHRNWTAVGHPDLPVYPVIDPRGLITPLYDGWSIDFWMIGENAARLLPSRLDRVEQKLITDQSLVIETEARHEGLRLKHQVSLELENGQPKLCIAVEAGSNQNADLIVAIRPYNPEGIQFIEQIEYDTARKQLSVDKLTEIQMSRSPERLCFANYQQGDVLHLLKSRDDQTSIHCPIGMATCAAVFPLDRQSHEQTLEINIPLDKELKREQAHPDALSSDSEMLSRTWPEVIRHTAKLQLPDPHLQSLYDAAVHTMLLLSSDQVIPGPYTYRRFWFRDACLMMNALLAIGQGQLVGRHLQSFPKLQKQSGYFRSQEGEWDSNGQVLWMMNRYEQVTQKTLDSSLLKAIKSGAQWIIRKRMNNSDGALHDGLFPPGFSAEHFGPNDYYYWDDFWGVAGLEAAAKVFQRHGQSAYAETLQQEAEDFMQRIQSSIKSLPMQRTRGGIPASPYRRMDSGAIGSMVADYPLQLFAANDPKINASLEYLLANCFHDGGFFQDMIHSGINAYLSLAIAQTLLRNGDARYQQIIMRVAELASPTGQWPEAIHPITKGGCMGDGQHGWAAAEWIMMIRNLFVREENDCLVIGSGLFREWLQADTRLEFGPTLTPFGPVTVILSGPPEEKQLSLQGEWYRPGKFHICLPGYRTETVDDFIKGFSLTPEQEATA